MVLVDLAGNENNVLISGFAFMYWCFDFCSNHCTRHFLRRCGEAKTPGIYFICVMGHSGYSFSE